MWRRSNLFRAPTLGDTDPLLQGTNSRKHQLPCFRAPTLGSTNSLVFRAPTLGSTNSLNFKEPTLESTNSLVFRAPTQGSNNSLISHLLSKGYESFCALAFHFHCIRIISSSSWTLLMFWSFDMEYIYSFFSPLFLIYIIFQLVWDMKLYVPMFGPSHLFIKLTIISVIIQMLLWNILI